MANWFYYDNNLQKQGPVSDGQLKGLAKAGMIMPETLVETEDGRQVKASRVNGLSFPVPIPDPTPVPVPITNPTPKNWGEKVISTLVPQQQERGPVQLSRFTYIFLAITCGYCGLQEFYAKHTVFGWIHFALCGPFIILGIFMLLEILIPETSAPKETMQTLFRFGTASFIGSHVWALRKIPHVTEDGTGVPMKE